MTKIKIQQYRPPVIFKRWEYKVMFGNNFYFLFSKTCFGEYKKKKFYCIFEIKNMFDQLKLKRQFFEEKKRKY